jgi:Mn-containing catalase
MRSEELAHFRMLGWELLTELATQAGQETLAEQFSQALETGQEHEAIVTSWLKTLVTDAVGKPAV